MRARRVVRHAKLLGTDTVGGRRWSTRAFRVGPRPFTKTTPSLHLLRRLGVRTELMAGVAGTLVFSYGVETVGLAGSVLHATRARVARAAAPQAYGKNLDLTLYALDGVLG